MERLSQPDAVAALEWLDERNDGGFTGYDPTGWEAKIWLVHAMYETDEVPSGITHDDVWRIERAAGLDSVMTGNVNLDEALADATLTGARLGASGWPGPGWHRLLWRELATRLDIDPYALEVPPCFRSFPYSSWPANIAPPAAGSLDREQFARLVDHLAEASDDGYLTVCTAYRSRLASWDFDNHVLFKCELRELTGLYEDEGRRSGAPTNIWPEDKAWFTYTDHDLWGTKVNGARDLIARVVEDEELEAVTLDF